jgi:hypothetical protein
VGGTAFVLTGVIGDHASRDGHRHSRLLRGDARGFELLTVDHDEGSTRVDLKGRWDDPGPPQYLVPQEDLLCDPEAGWLCSRVDCSVDFQAAPAPAQAGPKWLSANAETMLLHQDELVVEYDVATMAPIGVAAQGVPGGAVVRLVDAAGAEVDAVNTDGAAAVALEVADAASGALLQRVARNDQGRFYQIFQHNKWRARKAKEAEEAAAAAAGAAEPAGVA